MEDNKISERLLKLVKPLGPGEVRVFKLVNMPVDPVTKKEKPIPGKTTCGTFKIYDKFDKQNKYIRNITGTYTEMVDGKPVVRETVGDIDFDRRGNCIVKYNEPNKLICLTLANENKSNPFRDPSVPPMFYEVKPKEETAQSREQLDYEYHAQTLVREAITGKHGGWKELAKSLEVNTSNQTDRIFHDMLVVAKENPKKVLRAGGSLEVRLQIYIQDALDLGLIMFFGDDREWKYIDKDQVICKVDIGELEEEKLIKHLLSNSKSKNELLDAVNELLYKVAA